MFYYIWEATGTSLSGSEGKDFVPSPAQEKEFKNNKEDVHGIVTLDNGEQIVIAELF